MRRVIQRKTDGSLKQEKSTAAPHINPLSYLFFPHLFLFYFFLTFLYPSTHSYLLFCSSCSLTSYYLHRIPLPLLFSSPIPLPPIFLPHVPLPLLFSASCSLKSKRSKGRRAKRKKKRNGRRKSTKKEKLGKNNRQELKGDELEEEKKKTRRDGLRRFEGMGVLTR